MQLYSHSRLSTFEKCPLQYRYRYIDRITRDVQGIEAFMGNRVHEVLEFLYRELGEGRCPSVEQLIARFNRSWDDAFSDNIRIVRKEHTAGHYRAVGERCIAGFYSSYHPFDQDTTVGLEEPVLLSLDPESRYQIQGYIDRLARIGEGIYAIHDYKTSSSLPSDRTLRRDRQLSFYEMGVRSRYPDAREVRLIWHYLAFDQTLVSRRTAAELDEHRRRTMQLIDTIEATADHPAKESALCRWCDYRDICPVQQDQYRAEMAAAGEAPSGPPAAVSATRPAGDLPAPPSNGGAAAAHKARSGRAKRPGEPADARQMSLF
ncbi:MAG TPA: PD-(D/E)XK nuclease family protein [Candidatus Polarisedimenticolia bacterium]|nr:PD-(D/E)XK nuclease family protein [Candidatus Polarisedimenticolia bacterium]